MIKPLLTLLLITLTISDKHQQGCLRINPSGGCEICDSNLQYYLANTKCILNTDPHCLRTNPCSLKPQCTKCKTGHYPHPNTHKCKVIPFSQEIPNCKSYNALIGCSQCHIEYYMKNGKCVKSRTKIEHCEVYQSDTKCKQCMKKRVLSEIGTCMPELVSNCMGITRHVCKNCKSGFFLKKNLGIENMIFSTSKCNVDFEMIHKGEMGFKFITEFPECQRTVLENCVVFKSFDKCQMCDEGYYLDENFECQPYPTPAISYCRKYKNSKECYECEDEYYLNSLTTSCQKVEIIQNCESYENGLTDQTRCQKCFSRYYYSHEENFCAVRKNKIDYCALEEKSDDTCKFCDKDFVLSIDKLLCKKKLKNCKQHGDFMADDREPLVCIECKLGFHLDDESLTKCLKGQSDPEEYCVIVSDTDPSKCETCEIGYSLDLLGRCQKKIQIQDCLSYDESTSGNSCEECKPGMILFNLENTCRKVQNRIKYCVSYFNEQKCDRCQKSYYLVVTGNNSLCLPNPKGSNCEEYDQYQKCLTCQSQFVLEKGKCYAPLKLHVSHCSVRGYSNVGGKNSVNQVKCKVCEENSYPYNFRDKYYCLQDDRIEIFARNSKSLDRHCKFFQVSSEGIATCTECKENYIFDEIKNECLKFTECTQSITALKIDPNMQKISRRKVCTSVVSKGNGCKFSVPFVNNTNQLECTNCKNSFIEIIHQWDEDISFYIPYREFSMTGTQISRSPVSFYPRITCLPESHQKVVKQVDNCDYYAELGEIVGCVKCNNGFAGTIHSEGYIIRCLKMTTCKTGIIPGVTKNVNKIASCHECQQEDEIPFVFFAGGTIYEGIKQLDSYDETFRTSDTQTGGKSFQCLKPNFQSMKIPHSEFKFPENCAIGFYNINSTKNSKSSIDSGRMKRDELAVFCGTCKQSYKAFTGDMDSDFQDVIYKCEPINNCDHSDWFNYCSHCKIGHVYGYNSTDGVVYDQCLKMKTNLHAEVCLAAAQENGHTKCKICKVGHFMDSDSNCQKISLRSCVDFSTEIKFTQNHYSTAIHYFHQMEGCTGCHNSAIDKLFLHSPAEDFNVCLQTGATRFISVLSGHVQNCDQYYAQEKGKCYTCRSGYTINSSHTRCTNEQIPSCIEVRNDDSKKCSVCEDSFHQIRGICVKSKLKNCLIPDQDYQEYDTDEQIDISTIQHKCVSCNARYFLNTKLQCSKGEVMYCEVYDSTPSLCLECQQGYILGQTSEEYSFCIKINQNASCKVYESISANGTISCQECNQYHTLVDFDGSNKDTPRSQCLKADLIEGCQKYDTDEDYSNYNNTYNCKSCKPLFYLNGGTCTLRLRKLDNCHQKSDIKDECEICKNGYFVGDNGRCLPNPNGLDNCVNYSNVKNCSRCEPGYFITKEQSCQASNNSIENCFDMQKDGVCDSCIQGFYLQDNECQKGQVRNCAFFDSRDNCQVCKEGHGLQKEDGIEYCVEIDQKENCFKQQQEYPFKCQQCSGHYILDQQTHNCVELEKTKRVHGCVLYTPMEICEFGECENINNIMLCEKCEVGKLLNDMKTKCESFSNSQKRQLDHCENAFTEGQQCQICKPGFKLDEKNNCIDCPQKNCAYCENNKCLMCLSGYHMMVNHECMRNKVLVSNVDTTKGNMINGLRCLVVLLIGFVW